MWIWVDHGTKYREKDWTKSDLRGVRIYEEEWTEWMKTMERVEASVSMAKEKSRMCGYGLSMVQNIRKRIGQRVIFGESRYMKRNGLDG